MLIKLSKLFATKLTKVEIAEVCKEVHCVDLGESFQTHIYLQTLASIQPRTSPVKFARSPNECSRPKRATHVASRAAVKNAATRATLRALGGRTLEGIGLKKD